MLSDDLELPLPLLQLQVDHPDLLLLLSDLLLAILEDVLLDVGLLIEDAKFVVSVDELDTHVVATLACLLILVDEVVHVFLQGVDDQVQLVTLVDQLTDGAELLAELELVLVQAVSQLVSLVNFPCLLVLDVDESTVFLGTLGSQDIDLILKDLDALFHFCEILAGRLDLTDVLVPGVLDLFVESDEGVQLEFSVLLLLGQIEDQKLFHLELLTSLSGLGGGLRSCSCHLLSDGLQELDLDEELTLVILEFAHFLLLRCNHFFDVLDLSLKGSVLETFLDKLTNEDLLLFMQVSLSIFILLMLR